jgi:hypothetical protein
VWSIKLFAALVKHPIDIGQRGIAPYDGQKVVKLARELAQKRQNVIWCESLKIIFLGRTLTAGVEEEFQLPKLRG